MIALKITTEKLLDISRLCAIAAIVLGPFSSALMSIAFILLILSLAASRQIQKAMTTAITTAPGKALALLTFILLMGFFNSSVNIYQSADTLWSWRKLGYMFLLLGIFCSNTWKSHFVRSFIIGMSLALLLSYLAWFEIIPSKANLGIMTKNYTIQSMSFIAASICCVVTMRDVHGYLKFAYIGLIVLFTFNILYISQSRSGYLAYFVSLSIAGIFTYGWKKVPYVLLGLTSILLIAVFSSQTMQDRIKHGITEINSYETSDKLTSIGVRAVYAENSVELIKEHPFIGYGTGSFEKVYTEHVISKYSDWRADPTSDPHNQYLYVLIENGMLGLTVFFCFIIISIRQGLLHGPYGIIGACVLIAWTVSSFFNSHFKTFYEGHILSLFLGAMLSPIPNKKVQ
jgi:O-antigen ligase